MKHIVAARTVSGTVPNVTSRKYKDGEVFDTGALLVLDANGELVECAADPAEVTCIAAEPSDSRPGYQAGNNPTVVTGRKQEVTVYDANDNNIFSMVSAAGTTPAQTHINEQYGAVATNGVWALDLTETTTKVFEVVDIDVDQKLFFCKVIESVRSF